MSQRGVEEGGPEIEAAEPPKASLRERTSTVNLLLTGENTTELSNCLCPEKKGDREPTGGAFNFSVFPDKARYMLTRFAPFLYPAADVAVARRHGALPGRSGTGIKLISSF